VAAGLLGVSTSWFVGAAALRQHHGTLNRPLDDYLVELREKRIIRVPGTAVFLARDEKGVPPTLVHYVQHSHTLHEHVLLLTLETARVPPIQNEHRIVSKCSSLVLSVW
jgi:KUP system potassium uptake protein